MSSFLNIYEYYKGIFFINIVISILPFLVGGEFFFISVFLTFGFVVGVTLKEINNSKYYLFYYNNGLTKIQLWIFSFLINLFFGSVLFFVLTLIKGYFK